MKKFKVFVRERREIQNIKTYWVLAENKDQIRNGELHYTEGDLVDTVEDDSELLNAEIEDIEELK